MSTEPHLNGRVGTAVFSARQNLLTRQAGSVHELLRLMRRRWYLVAPVLVIWAFAYLRLFVDPTPRLPLLFNWTPSLPYHVAWMRPGVHVPSRGDLIVFTFTGEFAGDSTPTRNVPAENSGQSGHSISNVRSDSQPEPRTLLPADRQADRQADLQTAPRAAEPGTERFPGLRGQPFFKRVSGIPGDRITVQGRLVLVNGQPVGLAKTHAHDRRPLTPIAPRVIPEGQFYVQGTSADSFDSRYRESGLVKQEQVLALVHPLF